MRKLMLVALLGLISMIPGETYVQFGLRKVALEQGIAAARQHWSFEAAPDAQAAAVQPMEKAYVSPKRKK